MANKKAKRDKEKAIKVLRDFFSIEDGQETDFEIMSRRLYKATTCGAWISENQDGIAIGSIVEGSDADCETHEIDWKDVTEESIQEAIDAIEEQADELWYEANEQSEDGSPRSMGWVGDDGLP